MNYLLDTCVLSELTKSRPSESVLSWLTAQDPASLYLSALTIGELKKGIVKRGDDVRAHRLERWLTDTVLRFYGDRIIPVACDESLKWGVICGDSERKGRKRPSIDALIAATALTHHMTLVTRNVDDMSGMGVPLYNPFA